MKEASRTLAFSMSFVTRTLFLFSRRPTFSLAFLLLTVYRKKLFQLGVTSFAKTELQASFASSNPILACSLCTEQLWSPRAEIACSFLVRRPFHTSSSNSSNSNTNVFNMLTFQTLFMHFPVSYTLLLSGSKEKKKEKNEQDMYLMKRTSHNHGSFAFCIPPPAVFVYCHPLLCYLQFGLRAPWGKELSDFICLYNVIHTYGTIEIINSNNLWQRTLLPVITNRVHLCKIWKAFLIQVE